VLILSLVPALWPVVAVYFLGDISAHFNWPPRWGSSSKRSAVFARESPFRRDVRRTLV
jgi:hypothetical protein